MKVVSPCENRTGVPVIMISSHAIPMDLEKVSHFSFFSEVNVLSHKFTNSSAFTSVRKEMLVIG